MKRFLDMRLLRRLLPYITRKKGLMIFSLFSLIAVNVISVVQPFFIKHAIDVDIASRNLDSLNKTIMILGIIVLGGFLFQVSFNYSIQYLGQKILFFLRMDLFRKVLDLGNDFYDRTTTGKTLTNVTNDVEAIKEFVSEGIVSVAGELLKVAFIIGAMFLVNFRLAIIVILSVPLFVLATMMFRKAIRSGYRGVRKANSLINATLSETISGIREIKLFNYQKRMKEDFREINKQYLKAFLKVIQAYSLYFPIIEVVSNVAMVGILLVAHFYANVHVKVGEIFAFFAYLNMFFRPLRQLAEKFNMFQSAMAASERVFRLLDEPVSIRNPESPMPVRLSVPEIEFKNVNFAYPTGEQVLKNISFTVSPGEHIAIVGYTGSGKSTILKLLTRLYDVNDGHILIDGVDLKQLPLDVLRRKIAMVPQDVFLFTGDIRDNITLYDESIPPQAVMEAAHKVRAAQFIEKFDLKYEENILEEGKKLSVGQRQLLGFSRVFLHNPGVILLDEATSNIDSETEALMEQGMNELLKNRSAVIVAHRLSTIKHVDRILVMHKGRIVEQGDHQSLLTRNGFYKQLYEHQRILLSV